MKRDNLWKPGAIALTILFAGALVGSSMIYVVDQREMAVVLRFGQPVRENKAPGLSFKWPIVEHVRKLPSTRQFWGDHREFVLPDLPTKDDKKIEVIPWAMWRIQDPTVFVQRLRTMENAEQRVAQFTRGAIRDVITQYELAELVRSTDRTLNTTAVPADEVVEEISDTPEEQQAKKNIQFGRLKILEKIKQEAHRKLSASGSTGESIKGRGIELIDLGISEIDFVDSVRIKTFDRWVAERDAVSSRNVNEGERMKQEVLNRTGADVQRIEGEGQRQANETRGNADATVIRRYAETIEKVGEFYTFVRTLEAYENSITKDTKFILTTDNEFLQTLKHHGNVPAKE